ncbi:MAG: asparagine synthase B [Lachnospiraceae bacterium]|nr:asparagine synthase B [Lachnospiraceae bacterium]
MCSIMTITDKSLSVDEFKESFMETVSRGPDDSRIEETPSGYMCFHRLAIMGLTPEGMQPFSLGNDKVICNGEIYGFRKIREELKAKGYSFSSESDCEILLPMYHEYGTDMFARMGSEFAVVIYDSKKDRYIAARDPIGIRPLYYGFLKGSGAITFASEPKNLIKICDKILPFPPGYYYEEGDFFRFETLTEVKEYIKGDVDTICAGIREKLIKSVEDRLDADAPLGFLLSGGLDSSLVCAISAKILGRSIKTYAIGMETDPIDLGFAKQAAAFIGADHTPFYMTKKEIIDTLPGLIKLLGTWDITTIRASMGMYLCCKAIHENTDVRVLLTGEISDELFGYKYTDFAPSPEAFQAESKKRIDEIHMYDVLRADRSISVNSLEARVPFGDTGFVKYVMSIDPAIKMNTYKCGKYLLRHAFEKDGILPDEILWRDKAAFSDAVGHSLVDDLKEYAESRYSDADVAAAGKKYEYCAPFTKESLLYRDIFEEYYPGQAGMIKDFWMPNKEWEGCNVNDPSARVLSNYGKSGNTFSDQLTGSVCSA